MKAKIYAVRYPSAAFIPFYKRKIEKVFPDKKIEIKKAHEDWISSPSFLTIDLESMEDVHKLIKAVGHEIIFAVGLDPEPSFTLTVYDDYLE